MDSSSATDRSAYLDRVHQQYDSLHRAYDRTLLTVAGGALVLSSTFISQIAPEPVNTERLAAAWLMLTLCLSLVCLSYIPSIRAHRRALVGKGHKWFDRIADVMSVGAGVLLAGGLGALVWFVWSNLPKGVS